MKKPAFYCRRHLNLRNFPLCVFIVVLIQFLNSCTGKTEPFSIIEFTGVDNVSNYSKSFLLMQNKSDSINPVPIAVTLGDMLACDDYLFIYNDASQKSFSIESNDSMVYVNGKLHSLDLPDNDNMIPWFSNSSDSDFSSLQFLSFSSKLPESYLPYLKKLAEVKQDVSFWYNDDFGDLAEVLSIFKPKVIAGPALSQSDYEMLSTLTELEILMVSLEDSVIVDPLPALPSLKQIFLFETDDDAVLPGNFLLNNRQIERVIFNNSGDPDLVMLDPLDNLKELIVSGASEIKNPDRLNSHKKLEVVSLTGIDMAVDPAVLELPALRWMAFPSTVPQDRFDSFINTHPDLEMVEILGNDTLNNLQALSRLTKLTGLVVTDTVTDISTIKMLKNLKYLSLPADYLKNSVNKTDIMQSLPGTRIAANEGFCLGSGWLLLLLPLVLIIRFFTRVKRHRLK